MSEKTSTDKYGRKSWNIEAYEEEARSGRKEYSPSQEAVGVAQRYKKQTFLEHRADLLNRAVGAVNKHTLIGSDKTTTSTFGKNKRFGFCCPTCDLSFRDTLALVDHFNSPQHVANVRKAAGHSDTSEELQDGIKRASAQEVLDTIEDLVKQSLRSRVSTGGAVSLQERVRKRLEFEQNKARRKQEKRLRKKTLQTQHASQIQETELGKLMGFEDFGSTKS